jgi:predicted kinase
MKLRPAAIAIGGPPGAGKSTLAARLSSELGIPRLSSDTIGRIIERSEGIRGGAVEAYWIAYDVLFGLCDEFVREGGAAILDINLGWDFQWQRLEWLRERHPMALLLPLVLRCPREVCLARIRERHEAAPDVWAPPERYMADDALMRVWGYLERLDRPGVRFVDAARADDAVYAEVMGHLGPQLGLGSDLLHHEGAR